MTDNPNVPAGAPAPVAPAYAPAPRWNVLSIITLVLGILGFAIIPVITGHVSLGQIKKTGEQGKPLAIIGLVLGYLGILGWIIFAIVMSIALASGAITGSITTG